MEISQINIVKFDLKDNLFFAQLYVLKQRLGMRPTITKFIDNKDSFYTLANLYDLKDAVQEDIKEFKNRASSTPKMINDFIKWIENAEIYALLLNVNKYIEDILYKLDRVNLSLKDC